VYEDYSKFLLNRFKEIFQSDYKKILNSFKKQPKKAIRINTLKANKGRIISLLEKRGYSFSPVPWSSYSFFVDKEPRPLSTTIEYLNGYFYIQDPTSLVPVIELAPTEENYVLDMAASPGGKTTHMAQLMKNKGVIVAIDVNKERMESLQSNINRMGVENTIIVRMDAKRVGELGIKFDKILLDAPCSSDGTIGKNPRLKRALRKEDYILYPKVQRALIAAAKDVLKPGGTLVYSTCSMSPEEDEEVVEYAVENLGFRVLPLKLRKYFSSGFTRFFSKNHPGYLSKCGRIMPYQYNTQGFFIAKLRI
jgi:NOL1/NOP2/sun family putative RNA methylase